MSHSVSFTRALLPLSQEVQSTDPVGTEDARSFAALQRWQDRQTNDQQASRSAFIAASGNGTFDNRKAGEVYWIGSPPVAFVNDGASIKQLYTTSNAILESPGDQVVAIELGTPQILGQNLFGIGGFSLTQKVPSQWEDLDAQTTVDSWEFDPVSGEFWLNDWSGIFRCHVQFSLLVNLQNLQFDLHWEAFINAAWQTIYEVPKWQEDATGSPTLISVDLLSSAAFFAPGTHQRISLRRIDVGNSTNITVTNGLIYAESRLG